MYYMKKIYFLTILSVLSTMGLMAQYPLGQTFDASGTYTVPVGFSIQVQIQAWGGGAGGGGTGGSATSTRGGGGAGAYVATSSSYFLTAGTYTITIGAGGAANTNGVATTITKGASTILTANGGTTASGTTTGGAGGTASAITGAVAVSKPGGAGGNGATAGTNNNGGGGGGSAATAAASGGTGGNGGTSNNATGAAGGTGATTGLGGGGKGADGDNTPTSGAGTAAGAGGGGRADDGTSTGAAGFHGRVIIAITGAGPLPIKIAYFNAAKGTGYNTLNWSAECTSESVNFDIERSADGKNFTSINSITATRLDCLQPFNYVDNSNLSGTVYYRIKITDFNGKVTYSSVVRIATAQTDMKLVGVLPNPVSNTAQLNIISAKKDNVQLYVVSMTGQLVQRSTVQLQPGSSIINLDVTNLQNGMYTIKGTFSDGTVSAVKFVKQ
jgi:hypothetical protein